MKDLISIVVPVYNVEKYIPECVNSLISQTYKNKEIILVDDGSTDTSGALCDEFSKKYDFIKVIHKINGGLSDARNAGMESSKDEFIVFVDSDDYVAEQFIENLADGFDNKDVDISCCAYIRFDDGTAVNAQNQENNLFCKIFSNEEAMKFCYSRHGRNIDIVAWNKLYRKSLFSENHIEYPKGKYFEDLYTTFKLFYYSRNIFITNCPLYFYRQRNGSIMSTAMSFSKYENMLEALKSPLNFYKEHYCKDLLGLAFSMYCRVMINQFYSTKKITNKAERKRIQKFLIDDYAITWSENNVASRLNLFRRILFRVFLINPFFTSQILK